MENGQERGTKRSAYIFSAVVIVCVLIGLYLSKSSLFKNINTKLKLSDEDVIATVGGHKIYARDFETAFKSYLKRIDTTGSTLEEKGHSPQIKNPFLKSFIERRIFLLEAEKRKIDISPKELEAGIERVSSGFKPAVFMSTFDEERLSFEDWKQELKYQMTVEKLISTLMAGIREVTEDELKKYYDMNPDEFSSEESIKVCHWLKQGKDEAEKLAVWLKERIEREPDLKTDETASAKLCNTNEGTAGEFLTSRDMDTEIWKTLYPMATGEVSVPKKSGFGYHVFYTVEKRPKGVLSFEKVKGRIKSALQDELREKKYSELVEELKKKWPVKVNH